MPPAPALFSMTTVQPVDFASSCATSRETASVPPPGGNGTIRRIGRDGYVCAPTGAASTRAASAATTKRIIPFLLGNMTIVQRADLLRAVSQLAEDRVRV